MGRNPSLHCMCPQWHLVLAQVAESWPEKGSVPCSPFRSAGHWKPGMELAAGPRGPGRAMDLPLPITWVENTDGQGEPVCKL